MQVSLQLDEENKYSDAVIDETGQYRYLLWRKWNINLPSVTFFMLNPSTADYKLDDPTIRRCIGFAKDWGYGSIAVVNLFAYRATDPRQLVGCPDPIGTHNDNYIEQVVKQSDLIILAWGTKGNLYDRAHQVLSFLQETSRDKTYCLMKTKEGFPKHPLYVKGNAKPSKFFNN